MTIVSIIAAVSDNNVIGANNRLPWKLPDDMKRFKEKTMGHIVIMGRKTYESIPPPLRPLPGRTNIVITRQAGYRAPGCVVVNNVAAAVAYAKQFGKQEAFVVGGGEIYRESLPLADRVYLTCVHANFVGDAFFPDLNPKQWHQVSQQAHLADQKHPYAFDFVVYDRLR